MHLFFLGNRCYRKQFQRARCLAGMEPGANNSSHLSHLSVRGAGVSLRYMPLIVGQPHRCRGTLGGASHNSTTGPTQIREFKSSANTGAA